MNKLPIQLPRWAARLMSPSLPWRVPFVALSISTPATFISAIADAFLGQVDGKPTLWHFFATASLGISCSVVASAAYVLINEKVKADTIQVRVKKFINLFSSPGGSELPRCYVVVPQRQKLIGHNSDGSTCVLELPLPLHWADDIKCANAIQGLVLSVGGSFPEMVTPEEAVAIIEKSDINISLFVIGLNSSSLTEKVCGEGGDSPQELMRVGRSPSGECFVKIAKPQKGGVYRVDLQSETISVPKGPEVGGAFLSRVQDAVRNNVTYVVVGGLYAQGTVRLGRYLCEHWIDLVGLSDSAFTDLVIEDRGYVIRFDTYSENVVSRRSVCVGPALKQAVMDRRSVVD